MVKLHCCILLFLEVRNRDIYSLLSKNFDKYWCTICLYLGPFEYNGVLFVDPSLPSSVSLVKLMTSLLNFVQFANLLHCEFFMALHYFLFIPISYLFFFYIQAWIFRHKFILWRGNLWGINCRLPWKGKPTLLVINSFLNKQYFCRKYLKFEISETYHSVYLLRFDFQCRLDYSRTFPSPLYENAICKLWDNFCKAALKISLTRKVFFAFFSERFLF